jgi:TPR repeat protein
MYRVGWGVSQDYTQAMLWFRMAADQGQKSSQVSIGAMYANGWGVDKDCAAAKQWIEKAAAAGDERARRILGVGEYGACRW